MATTKGSSHQECTFDLRFIGSRTTKSHSIMHGGRSKTRWCRLGSWRVSPTHRDSTVRPQCDNCRDFALACAGPFQRCRVVLVLLLWTMTATQSTGAEGRVPGGRMPSTPFVDCCVRGMREVFEEGTHPDSRAGDVLRVRCAGVLG